MLAIAFGDHTARAMQPLASRIELTILLMEAKRTPTLAKAALPFTRRLNGD